MAQTFFQPNEQIIDSNGNPVAGAKLFFFESGTSTPLTTYSDNDLSVPNADPVVADAAGRYATIYLAVDVYKVRIDDADDVTIYTADPYTVTAGLTSGAGLETTTDNILQLSQDINAQTGTTYTYVDGDRAKQVTHANVNAIAGTLPQAGTSSAFLNEWFTYVTNVAKGLLTITPTTSTINGNATLVLAKGMTARIISDGTNYTAIISKAIETFVDDGELTVSSGSITPTGQFHSVDGEADADDTVTSIVNTNFSIGQRLIVTSENAARDITYEDGTGNISNPGNIDITTTSVEDRLEYEWDGTSFVFISKNFDIGIVIGQQVATSTATDSTTNAFLNDTSIPQTSEMDLASALDITYTPKSPDSTILIKGMVNMAGNANNMHFAAAIVKDSGTQANAVGRGDGQSLVQCQDVWVVLNEASTGAAVTYHVYYGGTAGTKYLNQDPSGNTLGGLTSYLEVTEYM